MNDDKNYEHEFWLSTIGGFIINFLAGIFAFYYLQSTKQPISAKQQTKQTGCNTC